MQWCGSFSVFAGSMTWDRFLADLVAVHSGFAAALWWLGSSFSSSCIGGYII
jgi:hypothetical protein